VPEQNETKLAVLLHADVVESTALVRRNESLAHQRIQDTFRRLSETIAAHEGIAHEIRGDALVAEFARASDAVSASLTFQAGNTAHNAELPDDVRPVIRVGLAMGEVIIADGTVTGEGIVLAQRLEQLAEPGGVCIQGAARETVPSRLHFNYQDLGEHELKGFDYPVRAYRVASMENSEPPADGGKTKKIVTTTRRPAVAVLPFENMSGDPQQEHFCDGITEDIITALSRTRWYSVTSRSSTFVYKGKATDVRQIAEELAANYVLEGSLRRSGERIRITAQLIDARTGNHVWANRYDYDNADEFAIQDDIAHQVASVLQERIWQDVAKNIDHLNPDAYGPYDYLYLSTELIHRVDPRETPQAIDNLSKAIALDPDFAFAHLGLGFCYLIDYAFADDPSGRALDSAYEHATILERLAPDDAQTFRLLSRVYTSKGLYEQARRCADRALQINPDDGDIIANKGLFHLFYGEFIEGIEWLDRVLAMHSDTPHTADIMLFWKSVGQFALADFAGAISTLQSIGGLTYIRSLLFSACYAEIGRHEDARRMSQSILEIRPNLRVSDLGLWQNFRNEEDRARLRNAFIRAGFPK